MRHAPPTVTPCLALLTAALAGCAGAPQGPTIDLLAYGPIEIDRQRTLADADLSGTPGLRLKPALRADVPARAGLQFGLAYTFRSVNLERQFAVKEIWRLPGGATRTSEQICRPDRTCFTLAKLDTPSALQRGSWSVEVWTGGQRVLQQDFEVVPE